MAFYVYILARRRNGPLYTGMTDNFSRRIWEHEEGMRSGSTSRYGVKLLVWDELHEGRESAFPRERRIKKWNRAWKLELIEKSNPGWEDLSVGLI